MPSPRPQFVCALASLLLLGCASAGSGGSSSGGRNLITRDQLLVTEYPSAGDAIRRLRPQWLRVRGPSTITQEQSTVVVYVDGVRMGGPDYLFQLNVTGIGEIRYIDGRDATTRFGTGHQAGAIEVRTIR